MIPRLTRRAVDTVGIDVHKFSKATWRWSYQVDDYYPLDPIASMGLR